LHRVAPVKRVLEVCDLFSRSQPFDRLDHLAIRLDHEHQTAAHDLPRNAHRTGSTHAVFTTRSGAGQSKRSQKIDKALAGFDLGADHFIIQGQRNLYRATSACNTRPNSARA